MRYRALAADFDGTLAHDGRVDDATWAALIVVSGRVLPDLLALVPDPALFDRLVVENGAALYEPATGVLRALATPPPDGFVDDLRRRGVGGIQVGHVIVATWLPHLDQVHGALRDWKLDAEVILNKGAVMILPRGVDKASGLSAALAELALPAAEVVAVGDAENDAPLLALAGLGVAVGNALPALKARAQLVTRGDHGAGVVELVERLLGDGDAL